MLCRGPPLWAARLSTTKGLRPVQKAPEARSRGFRADPGRGRRGPGAVPDLRVEVRAWRAPRGCPRAAGLRQALRKEHELLPKGPIGPYQAWAAPAPCLGCLPDLDVELVAELAHSLEPRPAPLASTPQRLGTTLGRLRRRRAVLEHSPSRRLDLIENVCCLACQAACSLHRLRHRVQRSES